MLREGWFVALSSMHSGEKVEFYRALGRLDFDG
jgi:hypothetical protein